MLCRDTKVCFSLEFWWQFVHKFFARVGRVRMNSILCTQSTHRARSNCGILNLNFWIFEWLCWENSWLKLRKAQERRVYSYWLCTRHQIVNYKHLFWLQQLAITFFFGQLTSQCAHMYSTTWHWVGIKGRCTHSTVHACVGMYIKV